MQPLPILLAAVALAAGTSFAVVQLQSPATPPAAPTADAEAIALRRELHELQQQVADLRARPASGDASAPVRVPVAEISDAQIEQALARYLAARGDALPTAATAGKADAPAVDVAKALVELRGQSDFWGHSDFYKKLFAAGKMDELITGLEQYAEQNPKDAQAQMDLGNAYLAYLNMDNSKWALSQKADGQFDRVLAIDENHWTARFTKAVSYTFWPDFLGKKKEAIAHFERLVEQQATMPARAELAQTYVFLGNLLEQRGEAERARQTWERGLRQHPDNAELRQKLGR